MPLRDLRICLVSAAALLGAALHTSAVRAENTVRKPRILEEPGEVTDVMDAFDTEYGDPFDIAISLEYRYLSKRARILRETALFETGLTQGGFTARTANVGQFIETTSLLTPEVEVGIYKDLAFYMRLPIVLSNDRRIDDLEGSASNPAAVAGAAPGAPPLFTLPFKSPSRSGLRYIGLGLDWGILNQHRDWTKPTWVFGVETRISAGTPMHACNANATPECAHPGDVNRNGRYDETADVLDSRGNSLEAVGLENRDAGITRGTIGLELHSVMSKRIKYIEPYGGISALFEFPMGSESDFGATDFEGALVNHPPIVGTVMLGMMVHPWENREKFMRLTFDVRFEGSYNSEGRDYSELFDAIGSSASREIRNPRWARYRGCQPSDNCGPETASVVDESSAKSYLSGLTVVEPYGSYRASGSATFRIAEYVKLNFGLGLRFDQAHGITHDQPCNPDLSGRPLEAGPCHYTAGQAADFSAKTVGATGVPNPSYRPAINAVGRRFYVDESITYEVFARGTVLF